MKALIESVYSVFYTERNKERYEQLLTDDYLLLEHGELLTLESVVARRANGRAPWQVALLHSTRIEKQ